MANAVRSACAPRAAARARPTPPSRCHSLGSISCVGRKETLDGGDAQRHHEDATRTMPDLTMRPDVDIMGVQRGAS